MEGFSMPNKKQNFCSREELKDLYENRLMTQKQIAEMFGVTFQLVSLRFKEFGIIARKHQTFCEWMTKDLLNKMYTTQKMSHYEIGKQLGFKPSFIFQMCRKYGIQSRAHKDAAKRGSESSQWKGGLYTSKGGYIVIQSKEGRVYQHRYIMEQHLGRKLKTDEHVHHINGNKSDNRIENLKVLSADDHFKKETLQRIKPWIELKKENSRLIKQIDKLRTENKKLQYDISILEESLEDMRCSARIAIPTM